MEQVLEIFPKLTDIGKKRLLENRFNITKFSMADDGINYKLINKNLHNPTISIERTPLLKTWRDSSFNLQNRLIVNNDESYISEKNFKPKIYYKNEEVFVHPKSFDKQINFPLVINQDEKYTIQYYITNNEIARNKVEIEFTFKNININNILNATLSETVYFDIYTSHEKNLKKNFKENLTFSEKKRKFSKSINIDCSDDNHINNSFNIRYKGNFGWSSIDTERYETSIKLMDEKTGQFQIIKLQIIPKESVNDITPLPDVIETTSTPDPVIITSIEE